MIKIILKVLFFIAILYLPYRIAVIPYNHRTAALKTWQNIATISSLAVFPQQAESKILYIDNDEKFVSFDLKNATSQFIGHYLPLQRKPIDITSIGMTNKDIYFTDTADQNFINIKNILPAEKSFD